VTVLYIGTATYDLEQPKINQTKLLEEAGCKITQLKVTHDSDLDPEVDWLGTMHFLVQYADVIVISGGNTLYATERWRQVGLIELLRAAMDRNCVLTGGSAGAICWFDAVHSDSADPETYKAALIVC
jgi:dipeptidase E